jgi:aspartate/methionine/tyrosine aminotransferase
VNDPAWAEERGHALDLQAPAHANRKDAVEQADQALIASLSAALLTKGPFVMAEIDLFRMERYQSLYWHQVEYDLSESGVLPMSIREVLGPDADAEAFLGMTLGYPLSEGSDESRANIAQWYAAGPDSVTLVNGGSEANFLTLWALLEPRDRLAFMVPNYMQGPGLGKHIGAGTDVFKLRLRDGRWQLDLESLERAVTKKTKVVMVCNPNNPTGYVLSEAEMQAVVEVAERVGAWIVADEIYRGAEVDGDVVSPTFWGRYDRTIVTSGLSKAFGMPGLRIGWVVAPSAQIRRIWERHDYTTLTPNAVSDKLCAIAMEPEVRERVLARTRGIIRANLPRLEEWISARPYFSFARPVAGAITYAKYDLPIGSSELVDRIRTEQSVLLVPGDMLGLKRGIRFGYGYDIETTMKGLSRADEVLSAIAGG